MDRTVYDSSTLGTGMTPHPVMQVIGRVLWEGAVGVAGMVRWLRKTIQSRKQIARLRREYGDDGAVICQILQKSDLEESTLRTYIRQIRLFDRWLAASGRTDIDPHAVAQYLNLKTGSTRSVALCAIRAVFDRGLKLKVTEELRHHGKPPRPRRPGADAAAELAGAAKTLTDMLLVLVANVFGLRPGQARQLKWGDLHLSGNVLTLSDEQSVTGAAATLGPEMLRKLNGALLGNDPAEPVFLNPNTGQPLTVRTIGRHIRRLAEHTKRKRSTYTDLRLARVRLSAKVLKTCTCRQTRRSCAKLLIDADYPLERDPGPQKDRPGNRRQKRRRGKRE